MALKQQPCLNLCLFHKFGKDEHPHSELNVQKLYMRYWLYFCMHFKKKVQNNFPCLSKYIQAHMIPHGTT